MVCSHNHFSGGKTSMHSLCVCFYVTRLADDYIQLFNVAKQCFCGKFMTSATMQIIRTTF